MADSQMPVESVIGVESSIADAANAGAAEEINRPNR